jgi:hypothetical protein
MPGVYRTAGRDARRRPIRGNSPTREAAADDAHAAAPDQPNRPSIRWRTVLVRPGQASIRGQPLPRFRVKDHIFSIIII